MKESLGVLGLCVDEPIGMDHPLFMARVEAQRLGRDSARSGVPLDQALAAARHWIGQMLGEVPQPLVDATVTSAWLECSGHAGDRNV